MRIVKTGFQEILPPFTEQRIQNCNRSAPCQCQFVSERLGRNLLDDSAFGGKVYIGTHPRQQTNLKKVENIQKREQGLRDMARGIRMSNQGEFDRIRLNVPLAGIQCDDYRPYLPAFKERLSRMTLKR